MSLKIVVGPFNHGFRNDVPAYYVDDDSFPTLINAYQWRNRVKRKRGTSPICRLQRFFNSSNTAYGSTTSFNLSAGAGNLLTGFNLDSTGNIVPGTVQFTDSTTSTIFTDSNEDGTLQGSPSGSGTINYATGAITITGAISDTISLATFNYYPSLPVMDIEDLNLNATQFPQTLCFDTKYSYQIVTVSPYFSYDVSFFANPAANSTTLPGYVPKTSWTPVHWNGNNYQQFWSTNYENALWATNGITIPFTNTNIGMQYAPKSTITFSSQTATSITIVITNCPLVIGDFVFFNEWTASTAANAATLNLQSGYVTACSPNTTPTATKTITITLPFAALATDTYVPGMIQYLTNVSDPTKDCLRFYDGDPTSGNEFNPTLLQGKGWINFAPPIYSSVPDQGVIGDLPAAVYYLIGARMIVPYKDRILFLGPVIQSTGGITGTLAGTYYLQDTIIFSQNGTPYYTASFTGAVTSGTTLYNSLITPPNQGAAPNAYFSDLTGYGGYITAGYSQPMTTVGANQDVLLIGFTNKQTKLLYTGNDILPFNFYIINSELGSTATFGSIVLDRGVITIGDRGITITDQQSCNRIDLEIPDQVFEFDLINNGTQRITAQRDFVNEWIYFSYPSTTEEGSASPFPNETIFYNFRDKSYGIFYESYTTYGPFRRQTGFTWATVGSIFSSWNAWNQPWNASSSSLLEPEVIAGNQQGFVVCREDATTSEAASLYIDAINTSTMTVTSPSHGLNTGDYVYFLNALGMTNFNSTPPSYIIWQITLVDVNNFIIASNPDEPAVIPSGTYLGNGTITRLYIPQIQSKQFPVAWGNGRKTRIGVQQYLFATTTNAQITLQLFLSQNSATPFNNPPYLPNTNAQNNSVIYSDILFTCQESTNLGLTPADTNLQQLVPSQQQTWHRMNTSLIGDTVQVGFTLYPAQMFDSSLTNQIAEIELSGMIIDISPSSLLS